MAQRVSCMSVASRIPLLDVGCLKGCQFLWINYVSSGMFSCLVGMLQFVSLRSCACVSDVDSILLTVAHCSLNLNSL